MQSQDESLLLYLNAALATTRTQEDFFTILVEKLRLIFLFDGIGITTLDAQGTYKRVLLSDYEAEFRLPTDLQELNVPVRLQDSLLKQLLESTLPFTAPIEELARYYPQSKALAFRVQLGIKFITLVPLRMGTTLVGMLSMASQRDPAFEPEDLTLLEKVGNLVAISLSNALAFEEMAQRAREKTAQLTVNNALLSSKNRAELFLTVATELNRIVPCDYFLLWLQQPDGQTQGFAELQKQPDETFQALPEDHWDALSYPRVSREDAFKRFASEAAIYVGNPEPNGADLRKHTLGIHPQDTRSILGVPLTLPSGLAGVLVLTSQRPHFFTTADLELVRGLVLQITLAMQNLFSFEQIEALRAQLERERTYLVDEINSTASFEDFVGPSAAMHQVQTRIRQVAPTDTTVLITGETGTGKELAARALHNLSPRKGRALIKLNCAALPAQLIESELFGHEKGAFTGAHDRRIGKFELADGGTIFLDEIGELPLDLQAKLLRVLQEKEFERIGGRRVIQTNVRVIAATNRILEEEVAAGRFRADLYYRLNVFPVKLPPLRERPDDIEPLLRHFLERLTKKMAKPVRGLRERDLQALQQYSWPGNIRELEHVLEQAVIISTGPFLEFAGFSSPTATVLSAAASLSIKPLEEVERDHIQAALQHTGGRVSGPNGAALLLGLKATTLEARMKKLGLQRTIVRI